MVNIEQSNAGGYVALPSCFHELYVNSSYGAALAQPLPEEAWATLNKYVPLFGGSYGTQEPDPLDQLVSHRSAILKAQVEGLIGQLYERRKIHEKTISSIDYDTVKVDSEMLQLEDLLRLCRLNPPPDLSKRQDSLERELMSLEAQRREAYTGFWKDRVLLRKEIIEVAGSYMAARAREHLLQGVNSYGI